MFDKTQSKVQTTLDKHGNKIIGTLLLLLAAWVVCLFIAVLVNYDNNRVYWENKGDAEILVEAFIDSFKYLGGLGLILAGFATFMAILFGAIHFFSKD